MIIFLHILFCFVFCYFVFCFLRVFGGFFYSLLFNFFFYNNDDIVILKKNMSDQLHRRLPSPGRFFGKKHGKICLYVYFYTFSNSLHVLNIATFRISRFCLLVLLLLLLFCIIYHQTLSTEQNQYIWNLIHCLFVPYQF